MQASAGETVGGHSAGSGAKVLGTLDSAENGSRVYFLAEGALTGENPALHKTPVASQKNLYVYERDAAHPTGRIAFLGALSPGILSNGDESEWANGLVGGKRASALPVSGSGSGDGHALLFVTKSALLPGEDKDSAKDLYLYNDESGQMACISCHGAPGAGAGAGNGNFEVRVDGRENGPLPDYAQQSRSASSDLSTVVFSTREKLSPEDENETWDAYTWQEGQIELISRGGALGLPPNSEKQVAISADGKNVFFTTRASLVGTDTNNAYDLYDARVGGGFPEEPSAQACADAESCHGTPASRPRRAAPAAKPRDRATHHRQSPSPAARARCERAASA